MRIKKIIASIIVMTIFVSSIAYMTFSQDPISFNVRFYHVNSGAKQLLVEPQEGNTLVEVTAKAAEATNFVFAIASYDQNGYMNNMKFVGNYFLDAGQNSVFSSEFNISASDCKIKAFLMESLVNLKPYAVCELTSSTYNNTYDKYVLAKVNYDGAWIYWNEKPNATTYKLYKDEEEIYSDKECMYYDTDLELGKTYTYKIKAVIAGEQVPYDYSAIVKMPQGITNDFASSDNTELLTVSTGTGEGDYSNTDGWVNAIRCKVIPADKFLYLNVNDKYMNVGDYESTIFIDYYDNYKKPIKFEYSSTSGNKTVFIERNYDMCFKTAKIDISDAKFDNSQNYASDFRISGVDAEAQISKVTVIKVKNTGASVSFLQTPQSNRMTVSLTNGTYDSTNKAQTIAANGNIKCILDDSFKDKDDRYYSITMKYIDKGTGKIKINYTDGIGALKIGEITKTDTYAIMTRVIVLKDIKMNKGVNGSDFTISVDGDTTFMSLDVVRGNTTEVSAKYEFGYNNNTTAPSYDNTTRLDALINTDTTQAKVTVNGVDVWTRQFVSAPTASKKYLYFKVDSECIETTDRNVKFLITAYANNTNKFDLEYRNASNATTVSTISKTNVGTFRTFEVNVTNACLDKKLNGGYDFRLSANSTSTGQTINVSKVEVINTSKNILPVGNGRIEVEYVLNDGFDGKTFTGYQGWFGASGDGSPIGNWKHWGSSQPKPGYGNQKFELWPDMSEYATTTYQTGYAGLGNGTPAKLFSSWDTNVINTHFRWMREYGIDGAAVQRFVSDIKSASGYNFVTGVLENIEAACRVNDRRFYIMYDITNGKSDAISTLKSDWTTARVQAVTKSAQYMKQNGKPVICIWGVGFKEDIAGNGQYPGMPAEWREVVQWLKDQGFFVIGGVPTYWRTGSGVNPDFKPEDFMMFDMISPWTVGRFSDNTGAASYAATARDDMRYCKVNNVILQPVVFLGFAWSNWNNTDTAKARNQIKRNKGEFLWAQVKALFTAQKDTDSDQKTLYLAMFDEYDEGTAFMKAASDSTVTPVDQYFMNLSEDGTFLSSDFYLRLATKVGELLKGKQALVDAVPVPNTLGPIYFRTGFANNDAAIKQAGNVRSAINVSGYTSMIPDFGKEISARQKIGYANSVDALSVSGTHVAQGNAIAYFDLCDANILITPSMTLSFKFKPENEKGKYISIDFICSDGTTLRDTMPAAHPGHGRGTVDVWSDVTYNIGTVLSGKTISKIIVGYDNIGDGGSFSALIDNLTICDN